MPSLDLVDVAIVGAGFAGACAAHALAAIGARVVLIDRALEFPDLFRAEKIEPDQARIMRDLGVLQYRAPVAPVIGTVIDFDGSKATSMDTVEQYGISYSPTVNRLRSALPPNVELLVKAVASVVPHPSLPEVRFRDGTSSSARLVVIATGGSDAIIEAMGIARVLEPSLVSLTFGFDVARVDGTAFEFNGFNYYLPPNGARIDYLTMFRIGERMRANLFTQLRPKDDLVAPIKSDMVGALYQRFPRFRERVGEISVTSQVHAVPTMYHRLRNAARPGVVIVGEEFQSVSPTTGTGLSRALTDVAVLKRHAPGWLASDQIRSRQVRAFYADPEKVRSDRRALGAWLYYHNRALPGGPSLGLRLRQKAKLLGWTA